MLWVRKKIQIIDITISIKSYHHLKGFFKSGPDRSVFDCLCHGLIAYRSSCAKYFTVPINTRAVSYIALIQ